MNWTDVNVACTCTGQDEANQKEQEKNNHSTCNLCVGVSSGQLLMALMTWRVRRWRTARRRGNLLGTKVYCNDTALKVVSGEVVALRVFAMRLTIALLHKIHAKPYLVMAALISLSDAKSFMRNGKGTMLPYSPPFIWIRVFEESTCVCPHIRNRPWTPQWWSAGRHRQRTVGEGLFNDTDAIGAGVASPSSPDEISSHHVHVFFKHHSANSKV